MDEVLRQIAHRKSSVYRRVIVRCVHVPFRPVPLRWRGEYTTEGMLAARLGVKVELAMLKLNGLITMCVDH